MSYSPEVQKELDELINMIKDMPTERLKQLELKMTVDSTLQGVSGNPEIVQAAGIILDAIHKEFEKRGVVV